MGGEELPQPHPREQTLPLHSGSFPSLPPEATNVSGLAGPDSSTARSVWDLASGPNPNPGSGLRDVWV